MDRKLAEKICSDLLQCYFNSNTDKPELDYDCKPFMNLAYAIWDDVYSINYSDPDLVILTIQSHLLNLKKAPSDISLFYSSLVDSVKETFELNKAEHFLIIPLHGSKLNKQISFENNRFHLIPNEDDEKEIFTKLSNIMAIEYDKCVDMFQHTKISRSPDFFKHNLLLIRIENQTNHVKLKAITIAIQTIYIIHILYWAQDIKEDAFFALNRLCYSTLEENHHVLIMSTDEWRCGHGNTWKGVPKCHIDLQFLDDEEKQVLFSRLFTDFFINSRDELTRRFINSLVLLNRGYQFEFDNDVDLATLLYTTSAESLLTENHNEKRLRLAAILPNLISIEGKTKYDISKMLDNIYVKRNSFVHSGKSPFYDYLEDEDNDLKFTRIAISKLILKYSEIDTILSKQNQDSRNKRWDSYVDQLFKELIFGKSE